MCLCIFLCVCVHMFDVYIMCITGSMWGFFKNVNLSLIRILLVVRRIVYLNNNRKCHF